MIKLKTKKPVRLYYYKCENIGDILNELLIEKLFGLRVKQDLHIKAEMISIGSILDRLLSNGKVGELLKLQPYADTDHAIHVWGTGFMYPLEGEQEFVRPMKIHALRGDLTRRQVSEIQGKECKCVLGDPGLLASSLLKKRPKAKYDVGIIPHYVDAKNPVFAEMARSYKEQGLKAVIINVKKEPISVLKKIASCKTILSTSLHGLIIADSFGIPNQWCVSSDKILGGDFKYRDYYSAFGVEEKALDLRENSLPDLEYIKEKYQITKADVTKKKKQLMNCFPYQTIYGYKLRLKRKLKK